MSCGKLLLNFHSCIIGPFCKFVSETWSFFFKEHCSSSASRKDIKYVKLTLTWHLWTNSTWQVNCLAPRAKSFQKSAQVGYQALLSRTHQFASHPLPSGGVLSQVDFPKWALGHEATAVILVGQFPWKQENIHVDLVAAFFYSHVLLQTKVSLSSLIN